MLCIHRTSGIGSALITHSNKRRFPSSSWRIVGFFRKVGANPSICLVGRWSRNFHKKFQSNSARKKHSITHMLAQTKWKNSKYVEKWSKTNRKNVHHHIKGKVSCLPLVNLIWNLFHNLYKRISVRKHKKWELKIFICEKLEITNQMIAKKMKGGKWLSFSLIYMIYFAFFKCRKLWMNSINQN